MRNRQNLDPEHHFAWPWPRARTTQPQHHFVIDSVVALISLTVVLVWSSACSSNNHNEQYESRGETMSSASADGAMTAEIGVENFMVKDDVAGGTGSSGGYSIDEMAEVEEMAQSDSMDQTTNSKAFADNDTAAATIAPLAPNTSGNTAVAPIKPAAPNTSGNLAPALVSTNAGLGRDVIYRARITVESDDVTVASREATAIVTGLGGIVFGQEIYTKPEPRSMIIFKVLPDNFSAALERLAAIGDLVDQQVNADDVTERIVNLQSRITTSEASVIRLRKILENVSKIEDVARIERELIQRETTLETLRGQLKTIRDQVDLATITLTVVQSPEVLPVTGILATLWASVDSEDPCLGDEHVIADPDTRNVRFCLEVENQGEATLTDLRIRSEPLQINKDWFKFVAGDFEQVKSGDRLVATLDMTLSERRIGGRRISGDGLNLWLEVTATPVNTKGESLGDISSGDQVYIELVEDESLPGFVDAIKAAISVLLTIGSVLLVVVGVSIPFIPLIAVVAVLVWWLIRRRSDRRTAPTDPIGSQDSAKNKPKTRQ